MYTWFTLLYTWSQHKIINQLYTNKLKKKKEEEAVEKNSDAEYFGENMSH